MLVRHIARRNCLFLGGSPGALFSQNNRCFTTSRTCSAEKHYKLVIVGGGTGGSAIASKFSNKLGNGQVAVVEPSQTHYYQPMFTLVGSGMRTLESTHRSTGSVLPSNCDWIQQRVAGFQPDDNTVTTDNGDVLRYEYLLVALGIQLDFNKIKGGVEALETDPRVTSNYDPAYVRKTLEAAKNFQGGNAIFTFPNTPIKCAGAPQKIAYLLDEFFKKSGVRDKTNMMYNTALPVIFGIPKYAEVLTGIAKEKNIDVNFRHNLIEIRPESSEAVFELLDQPGKTVTTKYDMLHVAPPCKAPDPLKNSLLADQTGFVAVDPGSLQHVTYPNVFGIGDCTNAPTAKTAAAVAAQSGVVGRNMKRVMAGKGQQLDKSYNGYTSCPLLVNSKQVVMAEFGYNAQILETFPVDQGKPRRTMFILKAHIMPQLYWHALVKGMWHGPGLIRKLLRLGMVN